MKIIRKLLLDGVAKMIPNGSLKKKMGCWYQNIFENNNFKMYYENGSFVTIIDGIKVKMYQCVTAGVFADTLIHVLLRIMIILDHRSGRFFHGSRNRTNYLNLRQFHFICL